MFAALRETNNAVLNYSRELNGAIWYLRSRRTSARLCLQQERNIIFFQWRMECVESTDSGGTHRTEKNVCDDGERR